MIPNSSQPAPSNPQSVRHAAPPLIHPRRIPDSRKTTFLPSRPNSCPTKQLQSPESELFTLCHLGFSAIKPLARAPGAVPTAPLRSRPSTAYRDRWVVRCRRFVENHIGGLWLWRGPRLRKRQSGQPRICGQKGSMMGTLACRFSNQSIPSGDTQKLNLVSQPESPARMRLEEEGPKDRGVERRSVCTP
jgi:hypothetical protein